MIFDILTLFPGMFSGPFDESIIKRGKDKQLLDIYIHNIRDWSIDCHHTVDDAPYGGSAGMLLKPEPLVSCIEATKKLHPDSKVIITSPRGRRLTHQVASELSYLKGIIIVCGRYEGIDERVRNLCIDDDISLGDFVLSGGEIAAMALVDSISRLIPGVLGSNDSYESDSFSDGLLEYPHYTRPPEFRGQSVPDVLLSGNHEKIRKWRRLQSLLLTDKFRPDLFNSIQLTVEDKKLLKTQGENYHA